MTRHFGALIPSTNTTAEIEYSHLLPADVCQAHYGRMMSSSKDKSPFSPPLDADVAYQAKLLGTARVEIIGLIQTSACLFSDDYDETTCARITEASGCAGDHLGDGDRRGDAGVGRAACRAGLTVFGEEVNTRRPGTISRASTGSRSPHWRALPPRTLT